MNNFLSIISEGELHALSLFFGLLGIFMFFIHIPKDEKYKYYRYSRYILGTAFIFVAIYCTFESLIPVAEDEYAHKAILSLVSMTFIWLLYAAFLMLIFTSRYKRRKFVIDGIIPIGLMMVLIGLGFKFPHLQEINAIAFAVILVAKCVWMSFTCIKEFNRVKSELDNYYDEAPHIEWMRLLIWMILGVALLTLVSTFIPQVRFIAEPLALVVYVYLTAKMLSYVPRKIEKIRHESVEEEVESQKEVRADRKYTDISQKLEPLVRSWVDRKGYVQTDISIVDVARDMGTNQNYLSKYINNHLNMTFSVWLNGLRVEESKKFLSNPKELSIEEIGRLVGFAESYNFSKWFKNITGETPYQFKKRNQ